MIKLLICVTKQANLQKACLSPHGHQTPTEGDVSEPEEEAEPCDKVMQSPEESILFPYGHFFRCLTGHGNLAARQALKFTVTLFTVGHICADQQPMDLPLGVPETELFMFKGDRRFKGLGAGTGYEDACL